MELKEKLLSIQQDLKAPKGRKNRFGGYYYRSTEDILTALKPLLKKHKVILTITDGLELIGDRYYVKATACLEDVEAETGISVSAYARETLERKKSDDSQLTGAASSYARKYALNGLFLIDDTRDPDTYEDDPEELDCQEEEKLEEKPARRPRTKKADQDPEEPQAKFYFIDEKDNVMMIYEGNPVPDGAVEITEEQFKTASIAIAMNGGSAREALGEEFMNKPEEPEEKPRTRRTRRNRS